MNRKGFFDPAVHEGVEFYIHGGTIFFYIILSINLFNHIIGNSTGQELQFAIIKIGSTTSEKIPGILYYIILYHNFQLVLTILFSGNFHRRSNP